MRLTNNVDERLWKAVDALAQPHPDIRHRLGLAKLDLIPLRPDDFPEGEPRDTWTTIHQMLVDAAFAGGGDVTLTGLSDEDAAYLARTIPALLRRLYFDHDA